VKRISTLPVLAEPGEAFTWHGRAMVDALSAVRTAHHRPRPGLPLMRRVRRTEACPLSSVWTGRTACMRRIRGH
jgi:hypothetical protein